MIGRADWFNRRRYSGWGLTPKTWQGFVYISAIVVVFVVIQNIPINETLKTILMVMGICFIAIDTFSIMASIKLDEREQKIEALAERNASWTMVVLSALVVLYVTTFGRDLKGIDTMPILIVPISVGLVVKGLTHFILSRRGI